MVEHSHSHVDDDVDHLKSEDLEDRDLHADTNHLLDATDLIYEVDTSTDVLQPVSIWDFKAYLRANVKSILMISVFLLSLIGFAILLFAAKSTMLDTLDIIVFLCYFVFVACYGLWIYSKSSHSSFSSSSTTITTTISSSSSSSLSSSLSSSSSSSTSLLTENESENPPSPDASFDTPIPSSEADPLHTPSSASFFLAEGSLSWWAIGASIIASNISAEHFIGMSGNGFSIGLSVSCYEWLSVYAILLGAVFFIPVYLEHRIFTMPQFLQLRFSPLVSASMAVVWLLLYVCINLTSILYLGALAVSAVTSYDFSLCMLFLALSAFLVTIGGMQVIGYTDFVQVAVLLFGGFTTTYVAVLLVSSRLHPGAAPGFLDGLSLMRQRAPEHFHLVLQRDDPAYAQLPGAWVLLALNIGNVYYWACNQYIVQRALGADLATARSGMLFAAFLKLFVPVIVVLPGIACYTLWQDGMFQQEMLSQDPETGAPALNQDRAYPVLLGLLPNGLKGLAFAALSAAIISSLASKSNSIATIFTLDIYRKLRPAASERSQIVFGRAVIFACLLFAMLISPFLGIDKKGGYQFIQEMTGFLVPGVFVVFLAGLFWPRATVSGALASLVGGLLMACLISFALPAWFDLTPLVDVGLAVAHPDGSFEVPFLLMMIAVFVFCALLMIACGYLDPSAVDNPRAFDIRASMFKTTMPFAIISIILTSIVILLYIFLW